MQSLQNSKANAILQVTQQKEAKKNLQSYPTKGTQGTYPTKNRTQPKFFLQNDHELLQHRFIETIF